MFSLTFFYFFLKDFLKALFSSMVLLISEFPLLRTVVSLHHNLMDARDCVLKEGSQGKVFPL